MPLYQIATDEGTLEVDHSGPLEDLTPAVESWVADKRDARLSAESETFREGVTPVTTGERIKDFAKGLPEQLSKSFIPEETIKKANVTAKTAPTVATALTGGASDFVRGIVGKEKFDSFAAGAINKAEDVAAGFVSPLGIGLLGLGALPKAIQKAAALGFTADIISYAPEKAHAIANAKTPEELGSAITDAVASAGMAAAATGHALGRSPTGGAFPEGRLPEYNPKEVTTKVNETLSEVATAEPPPLPPSAETQPGGAVPPTTAEVGALPAELKGGEPNATQEGLQQSRDQLQYQGTDALRQKAEAGNRNRDVRSGEIPNEAQVTTAEPTISRAETAPTPPPANTPTEGVPVEGVGPASVQPTGKLSAAQLNEKIDALLSRHQAEKDPAVQSQLFAEAKGLMDQLKTAEGESMGPGAASAEEDLGRRIVSMKNAAVDQARQERGLEPLMSEAKRTFGESWDMAQEVIAKDESAPSKLVDDLNSGKKTSINEVEQDMLLHEEIKLRNDRDMELERASDEFATVEERDAAAARVTELEDRLNQTEQANRRAGTYSGRALSIRRQMMYDDYTPAALERRLRAAKGGESLSVEEIASAKADSEKITEALRKSEERVAQLEKEARDKAAEDALKQDLGEASIDQRVLDYSRKIVRKWENEAKPAMDRLRQRYAVLRITPPEPNLASDLRDLTLVARAFIGKNGLKAAEFSAEMVKEFGNAIEPLIDEAWKAANEQLNKLGKELPPRKKKAVVKAVKGQAGTDAERQAIISGITEAAKEGPLTDQATEKYVKLLFRNFIDSGMRGLDKITDAVHSIIEPNVPGITKDQIRDAYSDYGKTKAAPTEPNKVYASQLRGEAQKVSQLKDILEKQQAPKPTGQQRVPPADVTRRLQKLINEAKKKYNIQPADPAKALKSALDSRKTYYRNKLSDLRYEIAKQEKLVRDKVSPPTDPELEAIKKEYEQVKAEHDEIFGKPELTDQQKLERAIKVAERAEQNALRTLEDARKGVFPGKKPAGPTSPQLEAIKARVEAFRQEAKELREMSDSFKQEAEQKKIQATEKQIAELDRKLREGDLATKPKTAEAAGELGRLQAERAALVKELARQRREMLPKRSPDEIALQSYAARLAREQADLLDRLSRADAGDVTAFERKAPRKVDISKDPKALQLKADVEKLKQEFNRKLNEHARANRTKLQKAKDVGLELLQAARGVILGSDIGVLTRQGLFAWSRPTKAIPATVQAFKAAVSPASMARWEIEVRDRVVDGKAAAPIRKAAGLQLTDTLNHPEELVVTRLLSRIPDFNVGGKTIKLSAIGKTLERFQTTFINAVRADLFDAAIKQGMTPEELKLRANFINSATGRSNIKYVPKALSVIFTSPRYEASRWEMLAQPVRNIGALARSGVKGELNRAALANLQDLTVTAAGIYGLYKLAETAGYSVNWNPTSSDFLKMRKGDETWDVSAGLAPRIRDVIRIYVAITHPDYKHNLGKQFAAMALRTINPAIKAPLEQASVYTQRSRGIVEPKLPFSGFKSDEEQEGWITLTPLIVQSMKQALKEDGIGQSIFTGAREFIGSAVNRYKQPVDEPFPPID